MCGKKRERSKEDRWRWKEEVMVVISWSKDTHKAMCRNSVEENMNKKAVSKAMRES